MTRLVHTSEMPGGQAIRSDLEPGAPVTVRVLEIDEGERQGALRLQNAEVLQRCSAGQPG